MQSFMTAIVNPSKQIPQTTWHRLNPVWEANVQDVEQGVPHERLSPAWQVFLLGDGSPTRHLRLLTGHPTEVDVIDMSSIGDDLDQAPQIVEKIPGPRTRRQVWLKNGGQRLAYAASWWELSHVDEYLQNRSLPIWASLATRRTELYRDVQGLYCGYSEALSKTFNHPGPFWGRHYLFWHHGQPLTLIYEVFSPQLQQYLGKS
ncbi:chorismate lyase [Romeriopsis navalis]|nr:chorismate lyase [Romeriopsis navalis]